MTTGTTANPIPAAEIGSISLHRKISINSPVKVQHRFKGALHKRVIGKVLWLYGTVAGAQIDRTVVRIAKKKAWLEGSFV